MLLPSFFHTLFLLYKPKTSRRKTTANNQFHYNKSTDTADMRLQSLLLPLFSVFLLIAADPQMSTTDEGDSDFGNTTGGSSGGGTGADTGAGAGTSFLHPPSLPPLLWKLH